MEIKAPPICLTIAGLDPSGGAGIIADIKTFAAFGCIPTAVVSSITFQNATGVFGAVNQTAESIRGQLEAVVNAERIAAVKTGMIATGEAIDEVVRLVKEHNLPNLVVDPVIRSTSGFDLIDETALLLMIDKLFPLSMVVTPNVPEAERIANMRIENESDIETAAAAIQEMGAETVLIKGGHFCDRDGKRENRKAKDFLFSGGDKTVFEASFIETGATRGTGCMLSAGIVANLALGKDLKFAVTAAKEFVTEAIRSTSEKSRLKK